MIRASESADRPALTPLYRAAFPKEDLLPLLSALLSEPQDVISLVSHTGDDVTGHVLVSLCRADGDVCVGLLGPLAVAPPHHRQGIGRQLVNAAEKAAREAGAVRLCLLGDPSYYGRLGYEMETDVKPPYDLPPDWASAWQSRGLAPGPAPTGKLRVPDPWQNPDLWQ